MVIKRVLGVVLGVLSMLAPTASADLMRTQGAARSSQFGLEMSYTGVRQKNFLKRQLPGDQEKVLLSFYIRPEAGFTFQGGGKNDIVLLRSGNQIIVRGFLKKKGNGFQLRFKVRNGGGFRNVKKKVKLGLGSWQSVGVEWRAASTPGAADGRLRVFRGRQVFAVLTGLSTGNQTIDNFQIGQISRPRPGWNGRIDIDDFLVRKEP